MKVEGTTTFAASPDRVYALFTDAEALRRATPGVQSLEPAGPDQYQAVMKVGVAGISGTYTGTLKVTEQRPPEHFVLVVAGKGSSGEIRGSGTFDFAAAGANTTVTYKWDVEVFGVVAGVGQRVLGGVANMLIGQFFKALQKVLAERG